MSSHIFSEGQEFRSSLSWILWFRVFHEFVIKKVVKTVVSSEVPPTWDWRTHFQDSSSHGYRQEGFSSSPCGPLHGAGYFRYYVAAKLYSELYF